MFGATKVVKSGDTGRYVHSDYGITFDSAGFWNFDNNTARNVTIFGVDNSSWSHADNRKNNFSVLGEGIIGIIGSFGSPKKRFDINFSKANKTLLEFALYHW